MPYTNAPVEVDCIQVESVQGQFDPGENLNLIEVYLDHG